MTEEKMQVAVDPGLCIGSLECNRIAARAFRLDDDAGVSVALPEAATTDRAVLLDAARNCPTEAISIVDENGVVLFGPET